MSPPHARHERVPLAYLALFIAVYAVQGVVFAYFVNFIPGYMRAGGLPEDRIRLTKTLAMLPFVFKFLAGPLSDRVPLFGLGHRKPYVLIGLLGQVGGLVLLTLVHPGQWPGAFALLALITVGGLALYDTCTDGMIVDVTPEADRSRVQGLLLFSRFFTATIFSWLFGAWLERTGNGPDRGDGVLWVCALLTLLPLLLMALLREPDRSPLAEEFSWKALEVLVRPRSLALIAFGTFYAVMAWGVETNLPYFYPTRGFTDAQIGQFASLRNIGRAFGGLLLPLGISRLGRRWVLRLAVLGLIVTEAAQAIPGGPALTAGLGLAFGLANGWTEAMFYVLAMEASDPRLAASTYALFMAVSNISTMGESLFGLAKNHLGGSYGHTFVLAGLVTTFAFALIRPLSQPPHGKAPEPTDGTTA